ncbi:alpha/beta hydrolase [Pendulispora rubella]|uniref:Alpha/beta hydrolase n=1 Tax=Pendulispora rubella TaxID=2741070 RepID=A0ABZ2LHW1_9BACT
MSNETQRVGLPTGQHEVVIGGTSMVYHVHGSGPVVVAHPGGPGGGWRYLRMPEVEKFATVVYVEPIGTGASGRFENPADYSLQLDASNVEGLRAHLGIDKIALLGHSYGGFVALTYALAHPDHLAALVLYDTSPTNGPDFDKDVASNLQWFKDEPWFGEATAAFQQLSKSQSDEELTATFARVIPLYIAHWPQRRNELEGRMSRMELHVERSYRRKVGGPSVPSTPYDVRPRLGEIKVPTLVQVGAKDFICSAKMAEVIHRGIDGSRLVVFPETAHLAHIETPHEYARSIREFLGSAAGL